MINWKDPAELYRDDRVLNAISVVLVGVASWELAVTFSFDWSIVTGRRKWRWPMVLYFLCRLGMIIPIWSITILENAMAEINCGVPDWLNKGLSSIGMCVASFLLAHQAYLFCRLHWLSPFICHQGIASHVFRRYAVWGKDIRVGVGLIGLWIGQVVLWGYLDSFEDSKWDSSIMGCGISQPPKSSLFLITFSYTMAFDVIVLCLLVLKLRKHARSGSVRSLLLNDGILYCIASIIGNGTSACFVALGLNPVMDVMGVAFSEVACTIAATRLFRHPFEDLDSFCSGNGASSGTFILDGSDGREALGADTIGAIVYTGTDLERDADVEPNKVPL